jgi:hypothetical protein
MPGSSTTPGRPGARIDVPVRVAFRLRNGVGAQDMNLYEAQWLAYALPYRRFAAALTDCDARLGADMDRYSFIVSDLHRLLVAGLPAHCEKFCTLPSMDGCFRRAPTRTGWIENRNVAIEYRWSEGRTERTPNYRRVRADEGRRNYHRR